MKTRKENRHHFSKQTIRVFLNRRYAITVADRRQKASVLTVLEKRTESGLLFRYSQRDVVLCILLLLLDLYALRCEVGFSAR